jgi:hypothetical protein
MTQVQVRRFVACPFSAAIEFAEKAANNRSGFSVSPSLPIGERVDFTTASTPDRSDATRKHDALLIAWKPQTRGMFPDFRGVLTVRPKDAGVSLQLSGSYEPPYGPAGKVFDLAFGRAIAMRTMRHLLNTFANDIEAEYNAEKRAHQPA